ncbi:MAG: TauD/TfdA family dioxygenase [Betaproteobacteria bacterium]|nr:TauD/TfdA family dioxygenase [Betaproteobacteria bacterium]
MQVTRLTPKFGAAVTGVDVGNLTDGEFAAVMRVWHEHRGLVAFLRQNVSDDGLLAFSRRIGALDSPPNQEHGRQSPEGYPDIYVVSNVKDTAGRPIGALGDGEAVWHTDMSYEAKPPLASMLTARELPASGGGDTWFCDMIGAFEDMPEALKQRVSRLQVKHDGTYNSGGYLRKGVRETNDPVSAPGTLHPAVIRIPQTGEAALYLGRRRMSYIGGLTLAESEALLDELWKYPSAEHRIYRHKWQVGDLVMWDNRTTMHRRDPFSASDRRVMHRTQIKGVAAPAAFA